jgi:hypothetical protein
LNKSNISKEANNYHLRFAGKIAKKRRMDDVVHRFASLSNSGKCVTHVRRLLQDEFNNPKDGDLDFNFADNDVMGDVISPFAFNK